MADFITCDNAHLTEDDIWALIVHTDGTDEYISVIDTGVAIGDLDDIDCTDCELTTLDLLRKLLDTKSGEPGLRVCTL